MVVLSASSCPLRCIAALLGADVVLTDLPDRLKLLKKNVELNVEGHSRGSATVSELTWGDDPDPELMEPPPEFGDFLVLYLLLVTLES